MFVMSYQFFVKWYELYVWKEYRISLANFQESPCAQCLCENSTREQEVAVNRCSLRRHLRRLPSLSSIAIMLLAAPTRLLPLHAVAHTPLRCTLLHARHICCPLPHACWLPAIHCDCAPFRRRLRLHQRTLLAATPTPPLLHTAARTPPLHHCSRHHCHLCHCWCHVH